MFRKLYFVAVPALLILLTASAVLARPLHVQAPPASLWTQVWQSLSASWAGIWAKDGVGMDPNGAQPHAPVSRLLGKGGQPRHMPIVR